jgi:hypothetical protein
MAETPCSWTPNYLCCDSWAAVSGSPLGPQATAYATLVLWAATARQFGECQVTVRPCGRQCSSCPTGFYWDEGTWLPYIFNGEWRNCWCGTGPGCCTCDPLCQVYLPGPVSSVVSVRLGGETLPVSGSYFVLDQQWLVRVDTSLCWPQCSDQNLAPGDLNAFEVTYRRGRPVPDALLTAAGSLACEYIKACQGADCRLPSRVASIARQGVSITMADVNELLRNGLTGLKEVDEVVRALNPHGSKGRTRFYSPDLQVPRTVTWP